MSLTEKQKAWHREWHAKNKTRRNAERQERYRTNETHRKKVIAAQGHYARVNAFAIRARRYGLTVDQLERALDGGCDICGAYGGYGMESPVKALHVDHCHSTGRYRGILCRECNLAIGSMADDPLRLTKAADYLLAAFTAELSAPSVQVAESS